MIKIFKAKIFGLITDFELICSDLSNPYYHTAIMRRGRNTLDSYYYYPKEHKCYDIFKNEIPIEIISKYYIVFLFNNEIQKIPITFTEYMDDLLEKNNYCFRSDIRCGNTDYEIQISHAEKIIKVFLGNDFFTTAKPNFLLVENIL